MTSAILEMFSNLTGAFASRFGQLLVRLMVGMIVLRILFESFLRVMVIIKELILQSSTIFGESRGTQGNQGIWHRGGS